jgi:hypothetical protein
VSVWEITMPWREAHSIPFTRIEIVAHVPSSSGIFAIFDEQQICMLLGASWNLKARLLELANVLTSQVLSITYEVCPDGECSVRREELHRELRHMSPASVPDKKLPGITFEAYPESPTT